MMFGRKKFSLQNKASKLALNKTKFFLNNIGKQNDQLFPVRKQSFLEYPKMDRLSDMKEKLDKQFNKKQLQDIARERQLKGWSRYNKPDLINFLTQKIDIDTLEKEVKGKPPTPKPPRRKPARPSVSPKPRIANLPLFSHLKFENLLLLKS